MRLRLSKHHGLGNDFLVALGGEPLEAAAAKRLCDRRRGIGADGLIVASPPERGGDAAMVLYNADGSRAEMSGNGIRCLAQALAAARGLKAGPLLIETDAGDRRVEVAPGGDPSSVEVSVDMGAPGPGPAPDRPLPSGLRSGLADLGNPHLVVLVDDPAAVALAERGAALESHFRRGVNVEFIAPAPGRSDTLDLRVWERGVGATEACGTGACAAAHLAHGWGLVGPEVLVRMPGGEARVVLGRTITLVGPAVHIADIEVELV
ncbi:MAG: diaminopimelate epimerase [Acidimicrobiales bacterium]